MARDQTVASKHWNEDKDQVFVREGAEKIKGKARVIKRRT